MIIILRTLCPVFPISIRGDKKLLISCCHAVSTISVVQMNGIHIDYPPVQLTIGNWIEEECQPSGIGSTCSPPRIGNVQIKAAYSTWQGLKDVISYFIGHISLSQLFHHMQCYSDNALHTKVPFALKINFAIIVEVALLEKVHFLQSALFAKSELCTKTVSYTNRHSALEVYNVHLKCSNCIRLQ